MGNLNSAIKRIENKGKKSVDPKKNHMAEVSPAMQAVAQGAQTLAAVATKAARGQKAGPEARRMIATHKMATKAVNASYNYGVDEAAPIAALAKGAVMVGKAAAKGAATAAKAGAKGAKVAAKTGAKATKKASSTVSSTASRMSNAYDRMKKPASRNLVRRNVKNQRYRKLEKDDKGNIVRGKEFDQKLYDQDGNKKTQGYMSAMDGPTDSRKDTTSGQIRQMKKVDDAEKKGKAERDKKVANTAQRLKKKTGDAVKSTVKKTGEYAKKSISATSGAFGTSSFAKEGITFKDYLNKL